MLVLLIQFNNLKEKDVGNFQRLFFELVKSVLLETVLLVELVHSTICLGKLLLTSVEWV